MLRTEDGRTPPELLCYGVVVSPARYFFEEESELFAALGEQLVKEGRRGLEPNDMERVRATPGYQAGQAIERWDRQDKSAILRAIRPFHPKQKNRRGWGAWQRAQSRAIEDTRLLIQADDFAADVAQWREVLFPGKTRRFRHDLPALHRWIQWHARREKPRPRDALDLEVPGEVDGSRVLYPVRANSRLGLFRGLAMGCARRLACDQGQAVAFLA